MATALDYSLTHQHFRPVDREPFFQAVIFILGLLVCLLLMGFGSIEPFSMLSFGGDSLATWNYAKSYIDGFGFRINPNLGFPGVQDNSFFPSFDFSYRAFLRVVGLFVDQAATSYYLMYLVGVSGMYAATFFALRSLGFRDLVCALGAIVYVVSPFFAFRSLVHDFLALYFAAPLGAAIALRLSLGADDGPLQFAKQKGVLLSLAVVATSGLYYAYFAILFLLFTASVRSVSNATLRPLVSAFLAAVVVFPILAVTGFGSSLIDVVSGNIPTIKRAAGSQLVLGLSFAEATHLLSTFETTKWAYDEYTGFAPYASTILGLHDWPGITLTLVIFISPLIIAVAGSAPAENSAWRKLVFMATACIVFGVIYSMNGGLAYYFNLFVNPSIRATGRIIPFLSFFALVALLAGVELLATSVWFKRILYGIAFALLGLAMIPSVGNLARHQRQILQQVNDDVVSIRKVLDAKDKADMTAVLQLPHVAWPEAAPIRGFDIYALQKYYILDRKKSPTKWSYGGTSTQPSYLRVEKIIADNKVSGLTAAARELGFDSALIEKQPFDEAELRLWKANFERDSCISYEDDRRILFDFKCTKSR